MEPEARSRKVEFEPGLVILFLVIAIPFTLIGSVLILGWVRTEMNQMVGDKLLGGAAMDTARHLDGYLLDSLTMASVIASAPSLHDTVDASNRQYSYDADEIERRLLAIDEEWRTKRGAVPRALAIVGNPTSTYLRQITALDPDYREILLTDRQGALVAATNITTDYYQADEAWWQEAFGDGERGTLHLGEVRFDSSVGGHVLEVAVPIVREIDEEDSEVSGVLKVLTDAAGLFSVVEAVNRGDSGHALLVRTSDGSVIKGPDPDDILKRNYQALARLNESLAAGERSFIAQDDDGRRWVAAAARLPEPSPASFRDWVVVVQQDADEANAPTDSATRYLIAFFALMGLLVVAFSLYMHHRLRAPLEDVDLKEEMDRLDRDEAGASGAPPAG